MNFLGVDPGIDGAIVVLDEKGFVAAAKFPTVWGKVGKKNRREYLLPDLVELFSKFNCDETYACIEKVNSMPGQGVVSMFTFGYGYGLLRMALASRGLSTEVVTPQSWKKYFMQGFTREDKKASLLALSRIDPKVYSLLTKEFGKDHNICDAYFLARFIREKHGNRHIEENDKEVRVD
jgi:crossover junction endodeoxyribonuclease RuvC